jgi:hypothetical protein
MWHRIATWTWIACLLLGGCSVFSPSHKTSNPKELLTKPITTPKHQEAEAEAKKPGWFQSWFEPSEPPPPKSMRDYMKMEPVRP